MIEFRGDLSNNSKKYLIKKESKSCLVVILGSLIACIPFICLTILKDWIFVVGIIPLVFLAISSLFPLNKKAVELILPTKIVIVNDLITCKGNNFSISNNISFVKKVLDYGEWYHIIFKFPHKSFRYLCQKDLLINGSLEEFEKIFEDKIKKVGLK